MGAVEVFLLILGGVIFTVSFLIPSGKADDGMREAIREEAKDAVAREVNSAKGRMEEMADETISHAMEKTERSLERVSNEKIMAVNEYSDTVLEEINKNHKEVMFLYDMLNDKHQNLQTTASQVEKTVKEARLTVKEVESTVKAAEALVKAAEAPVKTEKSPVKTAEGSVKMAKAQKMPERSADAEKNAWNDEESISHAESAGESMPADIEKKKGRKNTGKRNATDGTMEVQGPDLSFMNTNGKNGNNNEKILELHNAGRSNVSIAKELGLGVGEVKLVIDLFEGV